MTEGRQPARGAALVHVLATRPDAVVLAPVVAALERRGLRQHLVHTGQHRTPEMLDEVLADVGLGAPSVRLPGGEDGEGHGVQAARAMEAVVPVLDELRPAALVVTGAANTTVGVAVAAAGMGVPVARLEAGLREHDWTVPEEINRVLLDATSDALFASSAQAVANLKAERIGEGRVHLVGSTAVDSLRRAEDAARARETWRRFGLARGRYALVTLHRPANVDDDEQLARIVEALAQLARRMPVLFPVHPRTRSRLAAMGDEERLRLAGVLCTPPLRYGEFVSLEVGAGAVVTDSGTVQEETSALGVRCYTLRAATERTATLVYGTNTLLGDDPRELADVHLQRAEPVRRELPRWDGHSGERVAALLAQRYADRNEAKATDAASV